ncbi:MAG: hypothetical protein JWM11_2965 [Planctomycetaceae bacterium]|nr:hypothetical protein [Planctomycetaceae bacterium]
MIMPTWRELLNSLWIARRAGAISRKRRPNRALVSGIEVLECLVMPAPFALSISRSDPAQELTNASSVSYEVDFDSDVSGVDPSDFRVTTYGSVQMTGALVVTPTSASTYTVTLNGLHGSGSLRLDLIDDDSIKDTDAFPLGDVGVGNGSFQGETYQLRQALPRVLSIDRASPANSVSNGGSVTYTVTFDQTVLGVTANDFAVALTGATKVTGAITVSGTGAVYSVTVDGISGSGTLQLYLVDNIPGLHDLNGNPLASPLGTDLAVPQPFNVGETTDSVQLADLNHDGILDLIGASHAENNVVVALGNGDGTFQPAQFYDVDGAPNQVLVDDVNGDGIPDLFTLNPANGSFSLLVGNGDGTFQGSSPFFNTTGSAPSTISLYPSHGVLEDGSQDGFPDLIVVDNTLNQVAFVDNLSQGTDFEIGASQSTGTIPSDVAIKDLRGDGFIDMIVTSAGSNTVTVYTSNGDGGYDTGTNYSVGSGPAALAIADFNGDGLPDIATANQGDGTVSILLADPQGGFLPAVSDPAGTSPSDLKLADLNGDGLNDLVVYSRGADILSVLPGNSDGTFGAAQTFATGTSATLSTIGNLIAVGDLNSDGRNDLVIADPQSTSVELLFAAESADYLGQIYTIQDDPPQFTSPNHAEVNENTPSSTVILNVTATSQAASLTYSLSGVDASQFSLDSTTGALRFLSSPDYENPLDVGRDNVYNITVTADDGGGGTTTQDITITALPLDDNAPVITSPAQANVDENTSETSVILAVTATDADLPAETLSFSLSGPDANLFSLNSSGEIRFLASPDYESPTDSGMDNTYNVTVTVSDGGKSTQQFVAINVLPVNDNAPVISSPAFFSISENTPATFVIVQVIATDADLPAQTLNYSLGGVDAGLFSIDSSTGEILFLSSPDYEMPADAGNDNDYDISVKVSDGNGKTTSQNITITVTPLNDNAPVFTSSPTVSVDEETPAATVILIATATDADLPQQTLSYSLSGVDAEQFSIDNTTGEIRFLNSPDYEAPADANGDNNYQVTVTASDDYGESPLVTSQDLTIRVLPVNNNAPVVTSTPTANVDENTPSSTVILDVTATDADLPPQTLSYTLSGVDAGLFSINQSSGEIRFLTSPDFEAPADAGNDNDYNVTVTVDDGGGLATTQDLVITVLPVNDNAPVFTSTAAISVDENTPAAAIILDAMATDADLPAQTLAYSLSGVDAEQFSINSSTGAIRFLTSPDFEVPTDSGTDNVYNFTITASDGNGLSTSQDVAVTVLPVNDNPPVVSSLPTVSINENTPAATVILTVTATDADLPHQTLTFSLSGADAARFSVNSSTGEIRFLNSPDFEIPTDAGTDNVYNFTVTASDGNGLATTQDIAVTVLPVNDNAPVVTSKSAVSVDENTPATSVILDVVATDADLPAQKLTYSLSGVDAGQFSINSNTGEIRFLNSPDFEIPTDAGTDNVYNFTVTASDGNGLATTQDIAVTVLPVNDNAPVVTSKSAVSVDENTPAASVILDVVTTDADLPAQTLTYTLSGIDASQFRINSTTGEIRFLSSPDFESPTDAGTDNIYNIVVNVSDGAGFNATQDVAISVLPVNDNAPLINSPLTINIDENTPASAVILTVAATDADLPPQTLVYGLSGPDASLFSVNSGTGEIRFLASPDFESPGDADTNNVYNFDVTVNDGNGQSTTQSVIVNVLPINDNAPLVASPSAVSINENTAATRVILDVQAADADLPAQILNYTLTGVDAGQFHIDNSTGEIRFVASPDFEAPADADANNSYNLTVNVSDGNGLSTSQDITITVLPVNDNAPVETSASVVSVNENTPPTSVILNVTATDADLPPQSLAYSLSGVDAAQFSINSSTGEIRFVASPDFESPADAGADNVYNVAVTVSDGNGLTTTQNLTINVLPLNDNSPIFTSSMNFSRPENVADVGILTATDADLPRDTVTYAITGGADGGLFKIDPQTGLLSFRAAPDFEQPADAGADNVYNVTVTANDGNGRTTTQLIAVNVTNVDEPLVIYLPDSTPTYDPNNGPIPVDFGAFAFDPDTVIQDFRGSTLTITLNSPDSNDQLFASIKGNGPGEVGELFGNIVYESSLVIIGTIVSGQSGGPLVINLTSYATPAAINALLEDIYFQSTGNSPVAGLRTVTFEIDNAPGTAQSVTSKSINVIVSQNSSGTNSNGDSTDGNQTAPVTANEVQDFAGGQLTITLPPGSSRKSRLQALNVNGIHVSGQNISFQGQKIGKVTRKGSTLKVTFTSHAATPSAVQAVVRSVVAKSAAKQNTATTQACNFMLTVNSGGVQSVYRDFNWLIPQS